MTVRTGLNPRWGLGLPVLAAVLLVAVAFGRWQSASAEASSAQALVVATGQQARRVIDLRAQSERVSLGSRPESDVLSRVQRTLQDADLRRVRLQELAPAGHSQLPNEASGLDHRRQSFRFTLDRVSPVDLGQFLGCWESNESLWRIAELQMSHITGAVNEYSVRVTVSADYLAEAQGADR